MYCQKCGGKIESYANNCAFCGAPVQKYDSNMNYVKETKKENGVNHMTTMKWLGFYLLLLIPVVGWLVQLVLLFKWAFASSNKDLTLKKYARAQLIINLILCILICIYIYTLLAVGVAMGALAEGFAAALTQISDGLTK